MVKEAILKRFPNAVISQWQACLLFSTYGELMKQRLQPDEMGLQTASNNGRRPLMASVIM